MTLLDNNQYKEILRNAIARFDRWDIFSGKSFFITGASGMVGSFFIDLLMTVNQEILAKNKCKITAMCRNLEFAQKRFLPWNNYKELQLLKHDVNIPLDEKVTGISYCIHAASTTHPLAYVEEPVNTILSNIQGTYNLLEMIKENSQARFLLLSSVEVYGENRGDVQYFDEDYCGYINCNTLRAGYPEAKRASEALCQAYIQQENIDAVIVRLPRTYGPTMKMSDTKAISQFIKKGMSREDIVLKSEGNQLYSYLFVADSVLAILYTLVYGKKGEAYNVSDAESDIKLKDLAQIIADYVNTEVRFEIPDEIEKKGYSTATKALMSSKKIKELGWEPVYDIKSGLKMTLDILSSGF